jgi:hypothetical protein
LPSSTDVRLHAGGHRWPPKAPPLDPGLLEPGANPLADHLALELGEHTHHLEQRLAAWRGRIDPLAIQVQIDPLRVDLAEEGDQILK